MQKRIIKIALNICTFHREECIQNNLMKLMSSRFFDRDYFEYFCKLEIFIIDNAGEIDNTCFGSVSDVSLNKYIHPIKNRNTGGSGGFQRGMEEIRRLNNEKHFTHVIFMDDDVSFELESFYLLYDFLCRVDENNKNRPVAGRMLDIDNPNIQWTAAERWNSGNIEHVEFLRNLEKDPFEKGKTIYNANADYGGFWFCCYPYSFVEKNDLLPLFIHCDDVEYGLRCGKTPIIIEGVHVWHETWEKKISPQILYYDYRNSLIVNKLYGFLPSKEELVFSWKDSITKYHKNGDYLSELMIILALKDFLKGINWLYRIDSEKMHKKLCRLKASRYKNAFLWRIVYVLFLIRF